MQKEQMQTRTRRWLLPFHQEVDFLAIEAALRLAENQDITLVAASLIVTSPTSRKVRLELIQQSQDFLSTVLYKAQRFHVPVERYEEYTSDVSESVRQIVHNLDCCGLMLLSQGRKPLFTSQREMQSLLLSPPTSLVLVQIAVPKRLHSRPWSGIRPSTWKKRQPQKQKAVLLGTTR